MKNFVLFYFFMIFSSNVFSQASLESSTAITLSPFAAVTRLLETATATTLGAIESTVADLRAKTVAEKEQLKDEFIDFHNDFSLGEVREISQIRQTTLRELFLEISVDEKKMGEINSLLMSGSDLYKIAVVVTLSLF